MSYAVFYPFLAALAGVSVVMHQALNANLRALLHSTAWAGFASFAVSLVCMALLGVALGDPTPSAGVATRIPWWGWIGGVFGAISIGLAIVLVPKLGVTSYIGLMIAGQMVAAMAFDHFGLLGLRERPVDAYRLLGGVLLIGGAILAHR